MNKNIKIDSENSAEQLFTKYQILNGVNIKLHQHGIRLFFKWKPDSMMFTMMMAKNTLQFTPTDEIEGILQANNCIAHRVWLPFFPLNRSVALSSSHTLE